MYLTVLTRYLCIHRLSFIVHSAKRSEVGNTAAAAAVTDGSSGVVTRSQSDNHNLVPFLPGSNIPVRIHNDKSVIKIALKQMEGNKKETARKKSNSNPSQPELKQS